MSRGRRLIELVQEGSLYALLFLLPFSKAAVELSFGALLLAWIIQRLLPETRADTLIASPSLRPITITVLAYLAVCALSIVGSRYPQLGIRALFSKWLEYLMLGAMAADLGRRRGVVGRSLIALACSAIFVLVEALVQERTGYGLFRHYRLDFFGRMTGPYENPIDLATYLMVIIPLLLVYALLHRRAIRWLLWALALALGLCLARTEALGVWVGFGIGLLIMAWRNASLRRYVVVATAVAVLAAGMFFARVGHVTKTYSVLDFGTQDRWAMWQAALGMIRDRPLLGHGLNTFMANYLDYWVGGERQPRYAHNCYLQVAAETGVIGFGLFLTLLGLGFRRVWSRLRQPASDRHAIILVGFLGGLTAFAVHAAIDTNFYALRQAALFWVLAGLAIGLSEA